MNKNIVYVLLGGNLGNTQQIFKRAIEFITIKVGTVLDSSGLYESEPWGFETHNQFLNQVLKIETSLSAPQVMHELLNIEQMLGRLRGAGAQYESRHIDLDVLFFNNDVFDSADLTVPHPRLHLRRFTLLPLSEIAPELPHPTLQKTIKQLLEECEDDLDVTLL